MIRGSRLCSCNTGREDEVLLTYKLTSHQGDIRLMFCSPISGGTAPSFPRRGLWFLVPNMPTTPSTTLRSSSCSPALLSWFSLSILTDGAKFRSYRLATKSKVKKVYFIFSLKYLTCVRAALGGVAKCRAGRCRPVCTRSNTFKLKLKGNKSARN